MYSNLILLLICIAYFFFRWVLVKKDREKYKWYIPITIAFFAWLASFIIFYTLSSFINIVIFSLNNL